MVSFGGSIPGKGFDYSVYDAQLGAVTDKVRAGTANAQDVAALRKLAVEHGVWNELAAEFPKHFEDGYEIAPPPYVPRATSPLPKTTVPTSALNDVVGKTIVIRLNREDGGTSVVAGRLHSVNDFGNGTTAGLRFYELMPDLAARMATKDDIPLGPISGDLVVGPHRSLTGSGLATVQSFSEIDPNSRIGAVGPKRGRVDVRRTAESVIAGTFTPNVDLTPVENIVAGKADKSSVDEAYLAALKIERNAISAALIQPILARIEDFLAHEKPPPDPYSFRAVDHLQKWMFEKVDTICTEELAKVAGQPDTPMGKAYARLAKVLELESQAFPHPKIASARTDPLAMIQVAAKTPMSIPFAMAKSLHDPSLLGHAPSGDEVKELLKSAVPSLMRLASSDMEVFLAHLETWMDGSERRMRADALEIGPKGLEFHKEKLKEIAADKGVKLDTAMMATTGCPARLTINNDNRLPKIMELVANQLGDLTDAKGK
jgi:hypothetical protein